jgi:hypothetical protein
MQRAVSVAILFACSDTSLPHPELGWWQPKTADCAGSDIASTTGSATPDPTRCASNTDNGLTAVCWDQLTYTNPTMSGPWCTFKNVPVSECSGGAHPGLVFERYRP